MFAPLDVSTMLLMTAVASFAMAASMAVVRPERREGIGLWALGLTLHGAAYVLYALRGQVPGWASIVLANVLLSGCFALTLAAVEQFHGRPLPWGRMVVPMALVALVMQWYVDNFQVRVAVLGAVLPLQLALLLWALWHPHPPEPARGALLLTAGAALQWVLLGLRGWLVASGGTPVGELMQAGGLQSLSFVTAFVVIIVSSLGFILLAKDRSDAANRHHATHDELTGLPNRRVLRTALERDLAHAARTHQPYAVLLLDVDHFKAINDAHGHPVGDQVLRHVADVLRLRVRTQDCAGRYGGEEFLVLAPGTTREGALHLAEALRQGIARTPFHHAGKALAVTVSIGVCALEPAHAGCAEPLIRAADQALYLAKAGGRDRVEWATV